MHHQINRLRLMYVLDYDAISGIFKWANPSKYHKEKLGKVAGTISESRSKKYNCIGIDGHYYKSHRLAWLYVYGAFPKNEIDHINGDSLDNRIINLRDATKVQNCQNHKEHIKRNMLPTGVCTAFGDRFRARITVEGKTTALGTFAKVKEAYTAYSIARDNLHDAPVRKANVS